MGIYIITEMIGIKNGPTVTTTNNHVKDRDVALGIFEARSYMMLNAANLEKVIKYDYYPEDDWGYTQVELDDGSILEIAMSLLTLV
jgi:hypothetical protein